MIFIASKLMTYLTNEIIIAQANPFQSLLLGISIVGILMFAVVVFLNSSSKFENTDRLKLLFKKKKNVVLNQEFYGPEDIDKAIEKGLDLDGSKIPQEMLDLYNQVMLKESKRSRSGVKNSMRNRIVRSGSKHYDQKVLDNLLIKSGWEGLKSKEKDFFY